MSYKQVRSKNFTIHKYFFIWVDRANFQFSTALEINGFRACWKNLKAKAEKDAAQEKRDTFLLNQLCCKFKLNPSLKFKSEIKLVKQQD